MENETSLTQNLDDISNAVLQAQRNCSDHANSLYRAWNELCGIWDSNAKYKREDNPCFDIYTKKQILEGQCESENENSYNARANKKYFVEWLNLARIQLQGYGNVLNKLVDSTKNKELSTEEQRLIEHYKHDFTIQNELFNAKQETYDNQLKMFESKKNEHIYKQEKEEFIKEFKSHLEERIKNERADITHDAMLNFGISAFSGAFATLCSLSLVYDTYGLSDIPSLTIPGAIIGYTTAALFLGSGLKRLADAYNHDGHKKSHRKLRVCKKK